MPTPDKYGTQESLDLLRMHFDYSFWYDRIKMTLKVWGRFPDLWTFMFCLQFSEAREDRLVGSTFGSTFVSCASGRNVGPRHFQGQIFSSYCPQEIVNIQFLSAMNPKAGAFNILDRLQRHYGVFACSMPERSTHPQPCQKPNAVFFHAEMCQMCVFAM